MLSPLVGGRVTSIPRKASIGLLVIDLRAQNNGDCDHRLLSAGQPILYRQAIPTEGSEYRPGAPARGVPEASDND